MVNLANCGISKQASSAFQNPIIVFSLQHLIWLKRNTSLTFCRQQQTAGQPASQPASYSNLRRNYTIVLCTLSVPDNLRIQILVWPSHRRSPVEKERKKEGEERREQQQQQKSYCLVQPRPTVASDQEWGGGGGGHCYPRKIGLFSENSSLSKIPKTEGKSDMFYSSSRRRQRSMGHRCRLLLISRLMWGATL